MLCGELKFFVELGTSSSQVIVVGMLIYTL